MSKKRRQLRKQFNKQLKLNDEQRKIHEQYIEWISKVSGLNEDEVELNLRLSCYMQGNHKEPKS